MVASGSNPGSDDFVEVVIPSRPITNVNARMTAILEQLVRSNEAQVTMQAQHREAQLAMQEQHREQMAKSHEAQMGMQAHITSLLQAQSQLQAQVQAPPLPPVQPSTTVGTQVVIQSKEKDPNVLYEQFRKRGATEFHGTEDVLKADEWLEHIEDVFGTVTCSQKQKVSLISSMLREVAKTWWKIVSEAISKLPEVMIWETFKQQFQRKFVPEHVRQKKEAEFLHLKQGQLTVSAYVHTFLQLSKYATDLVDTEDKKVKRFLNGLNPTYKKMVLVSNKPVTFDDAIDRAYIAKEIHREKIAENESAKRSSSGSTGSWF
ncbi:hypothetical protein AAC387_Pa06g2404 [Persea americana]